MAPVYEAYGLIIPVEGSSTLQVLAPGKALSLTEIARLLDQSHQLIAQRISKLHALALVEQRPDPSDKRRKEYVLTERGEEQWQRLDQLMKATADVNDRLFKEIECDLTSSIDEALKALDRQNYLDRFADFSAQRTTDEVQA